MSVKKFLLPQTETIVSSKVCAICSANYSISQEDQTLLEWIQWFLFWLDIPNSNICPDCRQQKRLCHENLSKVYKRTCDNCKKSIISNYAPESELTVFCPDCWYNSKWSPLDYWLTRSKWQDIFKLLHTIHTKVPKLSLIQINSDNCDFSHNCFNSKNTYCCYWNDALEDAFYVYDSYGVKSSLDCWWSASVENSYEIINCWTMYKSYYCTNSWHCSDCILCDECYGCESCLMCYGLSNQKYHILNKEYSKEEFFKTKERLFWSYKNLEEAKEIARKFILSQPRCYSSTDESENIVGNYVYRSKDIIVWFNVTNAENGRYGYECGRSKYFYDGSYIYDSERVYNSSSVWDSYQVFCSKNVQEKSSNILYSTDIIQSQNCAFSSGLYKKSFCILNTELWEEEYKKTLKEICTDLKEQGYFGKFLPEFLSSFGYNETIAMEYFPLTREEVIPVETQFIASNTQSTNGKTQFIASSTQSTNGETHYDTSSKERISPLKRWAVFNWSDYEAPFPKVEKIIPAHMLPDDIAKIPDDILNWAVECEVTKKPFRIIQQELDFYRKHKLPIPRRHPEQRHLDRLKVRAPRELYERECCSPTCENNNGKKVVFLTSFSKEQYSTVYCKKCYERYRF